MVTGVPIAPIGQCYCWKTPVPTTIKSKQTVWKNFLISCDAPNTFVDAPTILMGKTIQAQVFQYIPMTPCLYIWLKLWWPTYLEDPMTPTTCGIKCLALKTCTCLFCNRCDLDNRTPEWSQNDVVVNLWGVLCCWCVTVLASCLSKDISLTCSTRYIKIISRTVHAYSSYIYIYVYIYVSYLPASTEKWRIGFTRQRPSIKGQ